MKEIKKCSISGLSFMMEEDAYKMLSEYLESLKKTYGGTPDGNEIIADIEARIAELILSTQDNGRVVGRPLIANIIAQLGSAEDISEESSPDDEPTRTAQGEPRIPRRLYRDMERARLGGVCSGLAKYFNFEIPVVRLIFCAPILMMLLGSIPFLGWMGNAGGNLLACVIAGYIVMWIAVPAARTARQKLEANGEMITVQSIRDTSANERNNDIDRKAKPVIAETVTVLGRIFIFLMKLFAGLIVIGLTIVAIALFIGLVAVIFASGAVSDVIGSTGTAGDIFMSFDNSLLIAVLGIFVVLIPVVMLLFVLVNLLLNNRPGRVALLVMFLLWIATFVALPIVALKGSRPQIHANYSYSNEEYVDDHQRLQDSIDNAAADYTILPADTIVVNVMTVDGLQSIDE